MKKIWGVIIILVAFFSQHFHVSAQAVSSVDHIDAFPTQTFSSGVYDRVLFNVYYYDWAYNTYPPCNIEIDYDDGTTETKRVLPSTSFIISKPDVPADMTIYCDGKHASTRYNAVLVYNPQGVRIPYQGDAEHYYTPYPNLKMGDANIDGFVNALDYRIWKEHYTERYTGFSHANFNNDIIVDGKDLILWLLHEGS